MVFNELIEVLNPERLEYVSTQRFLVKYQDFDGKVKKKNIRMFVNNYDCIGYFIGKATRNGYILKSDNYAKWIDIKPLNSSCVSNVARMRKRALDALKMLEKSNLWGNIKNEIIQFLQLDENEQEEFVGNAYKLYKERKYSWYKTPQIFDSFMSKRCWEYVSRDKYRRKKEESSLLNAITNKEDYRSSWQEDYDRSIEVSFSQIDGINRAWFSKEFRGCGNGHYYIMFDEKHAIFYEDD